MINQLKLKLVTMHLCPSDQCVHLESVEVATVIQLIGGPVSLHGVCMYIAKYIYSRK